MRLAFITLPAIERPADKAPLSHHQLVEESLLPNILHVRRLRTLRWPSMNDASRVTRLTKANDPSCAEFIGRLYVTVAIGVLGGWYATSYMPSEKAVVRGEL